MDNAVFPLPDPNALTVAAWLHTISRQDIHREGWVRMNRRFNGIAMAVRPYIMQHFDTPDEQRAAFDGLTLALMALSRFSDIGRLSHLLEDTPAMPEKFLPPPIG